MIKNKIKTDKNMNIFDENQKSRKMLVKLFEMLKIKVIIIQRLNKTMITKVIISLMW